ncbi:hypothetical protein ACJMK2_019267 [Sinanodonta woodiana]|uniref:Uncharacterized protein n=1 Tax=Sinanodonta woodiana TaxID=1069815 RepID=A0ABD3UFV7_SINWO
MKAVLCDAMTRRFSDISSSAPFHAATLLDSRFKDTYFNSQETATATNIAHDFHRQVHESAMNNMTASSAVTNNKVEPYLDSSETCKSDAQGEANLWAAHDSQPSYVNPSQNIDNTLLGRAHCGQHLLFLEAAAHKYVSATPTSVAFKQLCGAAGQL